MRKRYTKRGSVGKASRKQRRKARAGRERTVQLVLDREELVTMMQDSLTSFATEMGLKVASLLLEDEVNQRCGLRYERVPERTVTRYGHQGGVAVIAGQKLPIPRPRMRYTRQCGEADLETYARLQSPDAMPKSVLKRLVRGVRQGATENAAVCTALIEDLQERGLDTSQPTLLVLDGSKALHAAVKRVWGRNALIQRCQVHKKRNVREHLPEKHWDELSRQLHAAYNETDYDEALRRLKTAARWLDRLNPDAAASLREGMEETLTVIHLGVPELLRLTLATTNQIESAFSVAQNVTRRVKCWREGDMRQRWCVAGLMRAESKFHRVKGYRHMSQLLKALDRLILGKGLDENRKIA